MTQTDLDAYDRGFIDGATLRVEELRKAEGELADRRRWQRGQRLRLAAVLLWACAITALFGLVALGIVRVY